MAARAIQPPRPWRSMTTSPGLERASISATTRFIGGGGAKRSSEGRLGPRSGRMSDASRSAIARQSSDGAGGGTGRRDARAGAAGAGGGSALLELLGLLDEGLLIGDLDGQDALDVLDLLVLLVELQVLLEVHLLPHQRALRVGPQVAHLGGRREGDLAVVAGVLEDLADDDADVLVAETGHARGVLVALRHELQEACCDGPLDLTYRPAVGAREQLGALGRELDRVARVHLGQLARRGQVVEAGEPGLAGLLDEDADRGLAALRRRHRLLPCLGQQDPQPVDVALRDPVRRVERGRGQRHGDVEWKPMGCTTATDEVSNVGGATVTLRPQARRYL